MLSGPVELLFFLFLCSLQISVLFVLMRVVISLFSSGIMGSCGVFLLVKFLCSILLRMGCGRSLSVLRCLLVCVSCLLGKVCW